MLLAPKRLKSIVGFPSFKHRVVYQFQPLLWIVAAELQA